MPKIQKQAAQYPVDPNHTPPGYENGGKFVCQKCGREVHHDVHLCKPKTAGDYSTGRTEDELAEDEAPVIRRDDIKIMRGEDTGLYGEDEDHPQDIIGAPNTHGGFDVYRHL